MEQERKFPHAVMLAWLAVFAVALLLDSTVARAARESGAEEFLHSHDALKRTLKAPGDFWFSLAVGVAAMLYATGWRALVLILLSNRITGINMLLKWRALVLILLSSSITGINMLLKWMVGRTRPYQMADGSLNAFFFEPFRRGFRGLAELKGLGFPSGHVAVAFATAAALSILLPRRRWAFYTVAAVVAVERIMENAHWLSDTVAAAALGMLSAWIVRRLWWDRQVEAQLAHG